VDTVAVAMVCKTPIAGQSKTRLSPPLGAEDCARLSACFIRDVASTIDSLCDDGDVTGYAVYTPEGSETLLQPLLPPRFRLLLQCDGDLGNRLIRAADRLLAAGHAGFVLVNADGPTLPRAILRAAAHAVRCTNRLVIGPALDGGYTLIGCSKLHAEVFTGIPWSTAEVYRATIERARAIALPVVNVPPWYDVDDLASLHILQAELRGEPPSCAASGITGGEAPATRRFLAALADVAP
jgi:rSAM/selenodomain-associated transferase 1